MEKVEIRRKLLHFFMGLILVILIQIEKVDKISLGVFIAVMVIAFFIYSVKKFPIMSWLVKKLGREKEKFAGTGFLFYLIGAEIVLIFFSKDIAMAAIMILAVGDSVPNFVGFHFRQIKHPLSDKKFLEGIFAGMFFSFLVATLFVRWYEALIASVVALTVEGIDMKIGLAEVDDNLILPIVAGLVIYLIRI